MMHAGGPVPWMCYEVILDAQRIQRLLEHFSVDPVDVLFQSRHEETMLARLSFGEDGWFLLPLGLPFPSRIESGSQLTLRQGGQRLQACCQQVSRDGRMLYLDLPASVRYAQLRGEGRVSLLSQKTEVSLTLASESVLPVAAKPFDLSEGGVGALLPPGMPVSVGGPPCPVILRLPEGQVETMVDIRFVAPCAIVSGRRMGARFERLDVEQRNLIRAFLLGQQREIRRSLTSSRVPAN